MRTRRFIPRFGIGLWLVAAMLGGFASHAAAGEIKLQAVLVWGTNLEKSPDNKHKPVDPEVAKKLHALPIKWTNYYEVCHHDFSVPESGEKTIRMSRDCEIKVKNLDKGQIELTLIGKGQEVGTITQKVRKGETLVTGGNAENLTGWFIVLKKVE